jgi:hypothetical protein
VCAGAGRSVFSLCDQSASKRDRQPHHVLNLTSTTLRSTSVLSSKTCNALSTADTTTATKTSGPVAASWNESWKKVRPYAAGIKAAVLATKSEERQAL